MARVSIGFKPWPQGVDWPTLDATWAAGGELDVFDAAWANDHLTDPSLVRGGSSVEALTLIALLAHRVPGKWVGHTVLSNTFRHPAVVAKAATLLDQATGGRFILGLGRRVARGRARRVRHPPASHRGTDLAARVGGPGRPRAPFAGRRHRRGRHPG